MDFNLQNIHITCPIYEVEDNKHRWEEFSAAAVNVMEHLPITITTTITTTIIIATTTIISSIIII